MSANDPAPRGSRSTKSLPITMNVHTSTAPAAARRKRAATRGTLAGVEQLPLVSTKQQLAAVLTCSTKHVDNLTARGLLRPVRLGRCVRFRRDEVVRALAAMEGTAA